MTKTIYLAGGCFWGLHKYLKLISGVIDTEVTTTKYTPISVATQVVAGLNYKFLCRYDDKNGNTGECFVVIYKPLQGDPELTGIEKL